MKSNVIHIDNRGNGFENAVKETRKAAKYNELSAKDSLCLELCAEEILSLARSVTGEMEATFWLENEGNHYALHLSTQTVMDREKRDELIASATSRKNEAANTFLGRIRDAFEDRIVADVSYDDVIPDEVLDDLPNHPIENRDWDGYERSVLKKVSDQVKIGIRGGRVEMTVLKSFG